MNLNQIIVMRNFVIVKTLHFTVRLFTIHAIIFLRFDIDFKLLNIFSNRIKSAVTKKYYIKMNIRRPLFTLIKVKSIIIFVSS